MITEKDMNTLRDGHPIEYYLHERYVTRSRRKEKLLAAYYALRPFLPRSFQLALRRRYARKQALTPFPRWPIEPILVERTEAELGMRVAASGAGAIPLINYWPGDARAAVVLTHDVEGTAGVENIARVRALERRYGVVSCWNFVPERYPFDKRILKELTDEGCEIGVHGLYHDGKLFSSRAIFEERLPKINAYLRAWNAVGFRSPATHRNPDWMHELEAEYDSSFPDTDPFEPQPGGCCSIFPFFLGNIVELPITLVQDHTMIEILGRKDIRLWVEKADWIIEHHGLVNIIIHPDYMVKPESLRLYEDFLRYITSKNDVWFALPREVARWWRDREHSTIILPDEGQAFIKGPAADRASVAWVSVVQGELHYTYEHRVLHSTAKR
jgi:hypothetical protein